MGTKIILLGDPQQIDHPLLDERTNGLSYAAEKMKGSPLCWQVTMSAEECERSALAMDAVKKDVNEFDFIYAQERLIAI